jgi:hypothetical protein
MDLHMPEMDGYSTTHHIRNELSAPVNTTPIIAVTAAAIKGEKERCLSEGMNDYISKPYKPHELISKIDALIELSFPDLSEYNYLDLGYLRDITDRNPKLINDFLDAFLEQLPEYQEKIYKGLAEKDWKNVALAAHSLKSSFAMMGSHDLQSIMKQLEILAKESPDDTEIRRLFNNFTVSINSMLEELELYKSKLT